MDENTDQAVIRHISILNRNFVILAIIVFLSTLISSLEYGFYAILFQDPLFVLYSYLLEPLVYQVFLIMNFFQRIPNIVMLTIVIVNVVYLYKIIGHKSFRIYLILIGCIIGLSVLSVLHFYLSVLFLIEVFYTSALAQLDPDFLLLAITNFIELILWYRLRSFIKITPHFSLPRKKKWILGISIIIFAVYLSLLMKMIFIFDEVDWLRKWFDGYNNYYSFIFSISACVEGVKSILYFMGGMITGIIKKKVIPINRFNVTTKQ